MTKQFITYQVEIMWHMHLHKTNTYRN